MNVWNHTVSLKNQMIGGSCKNDYMWYPSIRDRECNNACKTDTYLDIKNCSHEKRLIGEL